MSPSVTKRLRMRRCFVLRMALARRSFSLLMLVLLACALGQVWGEPLPGKAASTVNYTNQVIESGPWSVHVVTIDRADPRIEVQSMHAGGAAIGLGTLSSQVALAAAAGDPVAAVNGDFYERERAYAGAPRGMQIVNGELIRSPSGGNCFWVDFNNQFHMGPVASQFQLTCPDGTKKPLGLNGECPPDGVELYTSASGTATHTAGAREFILEKQPGNSWLPLRIGHTYQARVCEVRDGGNAPLSPDVMVVSVGPTLTRTFPTIPVGAVLSISTVSSPSLIGVKNAIGGGPILVRDGSKQKIHPPSSDSYEFSSMTERHPRSAIGWNEHTLVLVEVDGRQKGSVGMTLEELGQYLQKLGCEEAISLDGGGSATLWYDGAVKNNPCDGREREIANSLVAIRKQPKGGQRSASADKSIP